MRTRLDEIVEEEATLRIGEEQSLTDPEWRVRYSRIKRIAERAFRHGVERAQAKWVVLPKNGIQPAPAGEKPYCYMCGTGPHVGPLHGVPERRRGERRKGWEARGSVYELGNTAYRNTFKTYTGAAWYFDRRSGKDRRKP